MCNLVIFYVSSFRKIKLIVYLKVILCNKMYNRWKLTDSIFGCTVLFIRQHVKVNNLVFFKICCKSKETSHVYIKDLNFFSMSGLNPEYIKLVLLFFYFLGIRITYTFNLICVYIIERVKIWKNVNFFAFIFI